MSSPCTKDLEGCTIFVNKICGIQTSCGFFTASGRAGNRDDNSGTEFLLKNQ